MILGIVYFRVTDKSEFNMASTSVIPVNITDVNDEKPVFTSDTSIDIAENTPNGLHQINFLTKMTRELTITFSVV